MKIFKWILIISISVVVLWYLLLVLYFKSLSAPKESFFNVSYKKKAVPYTSLDIFGYSKAHNDLLKNALERFAKNNNMSIDYEFHEQIGFFIIILERKDIRIKVVKTTGDDFLKVFIYKEELWENLKGSEYRVLIRNFTEVFRNINLNVKEFNKVDK